MKNAHFWLQQSQRPGKTYTNTHTHIQTCPHNVLCVGAHQGQVWASLGKCIQLQLAVNILFSTLTLWLHCIVIAQKQDRWSYIWCCVLFQLVKFSGSVAMCPKGTIHRADNLRRVNLSLNSLTINLTKNTLDSTNGDWIQQMEDFVDLLSLLIFHSQHTI